MKEIILKTVYLNIIVGLILAALMIWQDWGNTQGALIGWGCVGAVAGCFLAEVVKAFIKDGDYSWTRLGISCGITIAIVVILLLLLL